jgi:accessory gene regulator protein AgrB
MGILKAGISIALGFFLISYIENNEEMIKNLPVVGNKLHEKLKESKETIIIILMGLINLLM